MRTIIPKDARLIPNDAVRVFEGVIFDVYQWHQQMFDGSFATFEMMKRPDTIVVIPVKDDKLVVIEQEQPGHSAFYDFPGGRHDVDSEDELSAAKRELLEETGMVFETWKLVDVSQPVFKLEWFIYTFIATDFKTQTEQDLDSGEKVSIRLEEFDSAKQLSVSPKSRNMAKELLSDLNTLDDLVNLPVYDNEN
jgi:ADP-ribose pyrophosphatase